MSISSTGRPDIDVCLLCLMVFFLCPSKELRVHLICSLRRISCVTKSPNTLPRLEWEARRLRKGLGLTVVQPLSHACSKVWLESCSEATANIVHRVHPQGREVRVRIQECASFVSHFLVSHSKVNVLLRQELSASPVLQNGTGRCVDKLLDRATYLLSGAVSSPATSPPTIYIDPCGIQVR